MQKISNLTVAVLLSLSFNAFGDMHKCVINGKTAYTDKKCPDDKSEKAITKGTSSSLDTSAIRQQINNDELKNELLQEQQESQQKAAPQQSNPAAVVSNPEIEKAKAQAIKDIQSANPTDAASRYKAKQAQELLKTLMGQKSPAISAPPPVQSPPQYVPSIKQWCQTVGGVTNCWK